MLRTEALPTFVEVALCRFPLVSLVAAVTLAILARVVVGRPTLRLFAGAVLGRGPTTGGRLDRFDCSLVPLSPLALFAGALLGGVVGIPGVRRRGRGAAVVVDAVILEEMPHI